MLTSHSFSELGVKPDLLGHTARSIKQAISIWVKVKLKVSACSEMALTGNPRSKVWVALLGGGLLPLMAGNK